MKKYFKIISLVLVLTLISFLGIANVEAQEAMKITKKTYINTGIGTRKEAKFYTNKGYAYCITPHRTGASQGTTLNYVSSTKGGGVAYLLNKAGTSDTDYLITQLAIWKYDSNYMPDIYVQNSGKEVVKRANALANEAKNNSNWTTAPTLKLEVANASLTESSDRQSYKSSSIRAVATNNTTDISVSLSGAPSGSKIVDANGNAVSTVKSNQGFYVVVPASSLTKQVNITVNALTKGKTSYVEKYSTGNSSLQDLVVLVKREETVKTSVRITATPVARTCEKVGDTYYGRDGKVVDETTYSIQCLKHTCEKVGDVYFGINGNQVNFDQFTIECEKHVCEKVGDKYFGPKGTEVSYEEYTLDCEKHTCEKVGDTYFDKEGNKVNYEQYSASCEKHTCEFVNNEYFGKDGVVVTEEQYEKECIHICEIYDNHYYGKWGDVVSPADYKAQCEAQVVPVPDTANVSPLNLLFIVLGSGLLGGTIGVITHFASNKAY